MKNIKFLLLSGFFILLMITSPSVQAQDLPSGLNTVGVSVGDSFNIKVLANDLDLEAIIPDDDDLGFDFSEIGLDELKFELFNDLENESLIPEVGDVVIVTVETLPSSTSVGSISLELDGLKNNIETGFILGTPVTFIDWTVWVTYLNELVTKVESATDIGISLIINNSDTKFTSNVFLDFPIPAGLQPYLTSLEILQKMIYDKTTGIQEMMKVDLTYTSPSQLVGTQTQSLHYELTDEDITTSSNPETSIETTTTPGYELFATVLSITIVAVLIKYKKKNK
ncbi:MAG: hypothetical protein HeimC3_44320 [Candidatus Heimdallarchaeota archaeon LC_3]|nr:MAG: hypothetical protein HeimC3_44320 [Candidatus Heimdallarchaeota archaeon LC_3]